MKKLVYISSIAAPHQIRLCDELQKYYIAESWFYDLIGMRAKWWAMPLGKNCKIIPKVFFKKSARYFTFFHIKMLINFQPDIVMLGGFPIPANYIAYCWARINKKKVIVFTEKSRKKDGTLRHYNLRMRIIRFLYHNVDLVMAASEDAVPQLRDEFRFGNKVVASQYASLIDEYIEHSPRDITKRLNFIFPNRLVPIYNPILAINIFAEIYSQNSKAKLYLNALGELRKECEQRIYELRLTKMVYFLDNIGNWSDLNRIYEESDILIFPALFSNGNFTIYEAMASGMGIVISNKILGNSESIIDGYNGYKKNPEKKDFVDAINQMISNSQIINTFATINRTIIKSQTVEATAQLYAKLINKLFS
jgi:glycosyltransferase involved in cell wall biosynthesis